MFGANLSHTTPHLENLDWLLMRDGLSGFRPPSRESVQTSQSFFPVAKFQYGIPKFSLPVNLCREWTNCIDISCLFLYLFVLVHQHGIQTANIQTLIAPLELWLPQFGSRSKSRYPLLLPKISYLSLPFFLFWTNFLHLINLPHSFMNTF